MPDDKKEQTIVHKHPARTMQNHYFGNSLRKG